MNSGFKGHNVVLTEIIIKAGHGGIPVIECGVDFVDDDGNRHASASHELLLTRPELEGVEEDGLYAAAQALQKHLLRYVEAIHFREPTEGATQAPEIAGIAETLGRSTDDSIPQG